MRVSEYIFQKIEPFGDKIAQVDAQTHRSLKFNEIQQKSAALTRWLQGHDLGRGKFIGLMSQNNVDFIWILLGILDAGATCHFLDPKYTLREVLHSLNTAPVDCLVLQKGIFKTLACPETTRIKHILEFGDDKNAKFSEATTPMEEVLSKSEKFVSKIRLKNKNVIAMNGTENQNDSQVKPGDLALILSSSGSTGLPKGVMITHDNILAALELSDHYVEKGKRALGLMPFHHAYGLITMLMCLCEGAPVVVMAKFSLPTWIQTIKEFSVRHLHVVPSLLVALLRSDAIDFADLRSVRHIWAAAAPLSESVHEKLKQRFLQSVEVHKLYGLTETTYVMFAGEFDPKKPGSLGKLVDSMQCKIIDKDSKQVLPPGSVGEVCFKGPMVTRGYINNPKATSDAIDNEGWFRTGDLGYLDEDGVFYFMDRIKDIIKYQGHQISPCELETLLTSHQNIKEAAVIGVSHDVFGQVPRAFIVPKENSNINAQDIHNYMKDLVAPFKQLRGGVVLVSSIPKIGPKKNRKSLLHSTEPATVFYDQEAKNTDNLS